MWANNAVTNPVGWAEGVLGSRLRYASWIAGTVTLGVVVILYIAFLFMLYRPEAWFHAIAPSIVVFNIAVFLPLTYIRALRRLLMERGNSHRRGAQV